MNELVHRGLLYDGLVSLNTPNLIARYNASLGFAGLEPVKARELHIDGAGWSPEVADEKKNPFYLCHDLANPLAIIISPEQFKKPVYFPIYSWMRRILRSVFDGNFREISDITATHGIVLDFENHIGVLQTPSDLLLLTSVTPMPYAGGLSLAAIEQRKLVTNFLQGMNCLYPEIRQRVKEHAKLYGDLRKRRVILENLPSFTDFQDFYTIAFGGVALFRGVNGKDVLVLEDQALRERSSFPEDVESFYLYDADYTPFRFLLNAGWIKVREECFRDPKLLDLRRETMLIWHMLDMEKNIKWDELTSGQKKKLVVRHKKELPDVYWELERLVATVVARKKAPAMSDELTFFLAEPASTLHPSTQDVLWTLLTRREPRNLLELYTHDKNFFMECYRKFGKNKRAWAAQYISTRYTQRMLQP